MCSVLSRSLLHYLSRGPLFKQRYSIIYLLYSLLLIDKVMLMLRMISRWSILGSAKVRRYSWYCNQSSSIHLRFIYMPVALV